MEPERHCSVCGKACSKFCAGCKEGVDSDGDTTPTFYCGDACQRADWGTHQKQCRQANARKQLYRGAELFKTILLSTVKDAFARDIYQVDDQAGKLHIHERVNLFGGPTFFQFPDTLVASQDHKDAILTYCNCLFASAVMAPLISKAFASKSTVWPSLDPLRKREC